MTKDPTSEFSDEASTVIAGGVGEVRAGRQRGFFGHPRGLSTLFFTEMWERFSYYGLRAILILYMTAAVAEGGLGFEVSKAAAIVGLYTAAVYLLALPGGWVADRIMGQRRAVLVGGIIIAAGHFSMAVESLTTFYLGLMLIVLGTGLLKPNISAMVGELYPGTDEEASARRDAGFSIFYMGINIGAFAAPLVVGYLGEKVDWHYGFGAAGVGMVLGLIQYVVGGANLGEAGLRPDADEAERASNVRKLVGAVIATVALIGALFVFTDISIEAVAGAGTGIIVGVTALYFAYVFLAGGLTRAEKGRVAVIGIFFVAAAVFWAGFEQASSSLNLVAEQLTERDVLGWLVPASWFQSINPLFIIALAPVAAWVWVALARRHLEPSSPLKFAMGLILLGVGFIIIMFGTMLAVGGDRIGPMWLVWTYLLLTVGELALSPVGLSVVTKLSPHKMVGQMMGIWFMAAALGNLIAGLVAAQMGAEGVEAAGAISAEQAAEIFRLVAFITIGFGVLLALFAKPIRRLMGHVH